MGKRCKVIMLNGIWEGVTRIYTLIDPKIGIHYCDNRGEKFVVLEIWGE